MFNKKTKIQTTAEKDKKFYSAFEIEHHKKYDGTFMLFGYDASQKRLLLSETNNFFAASDWADAYGCPTPDASVFTPCKVCCQ